MELNHAANGRSTCNSTIPYYIIRHSTCNSMEPYHTQCITLRMALDHTTPKYYTCNGITPRRAEALYFIHFMH